MDLDMELRETGEIWRAAQPGPRVDLAAIMSRRKSRHFVVPIAIAFALVAVVSIALANTGGKKQGQVRTEETTTTGMVSPAKPVIALNHEITQVQTFTAVGGKLWVTGDAPNSGPAHVQEIDSTSGAVTVDVTLPDNGPYALAVSAGTVWVRAQEGEASTALFKIDIATRKIVATLVGQKDGGLVVTPDAVWMNDNGGLQRVDPTTAKVSATIPLVAAGPYTSLGVVAGPLGVWTVNSYTGQLQHIDTTRNRAGKALQITTRGESIEWIAEINRSLWVEEYPDRLVQLDVNGRKLRTLMLGSRTFDPKTDGRYIWLGTERSHVFRVDSTTGAISTVDLPAGLTGAVNLSVDTKTGDVWASTINPAPRLVLISQGRSR